MAPPASVLSKTLQSITLTKIDEIKKLQQKYEDKKQGILHEADATDDIRKRIELLLSGELSLNPTSAGEASIQNMNRFVEQSRYDSSISVSMLDSFERQLREKLEVGSQRLTLANLYSRLLTEWMNPPTRESAEASEAESEFEVIERQKERLQELCDKFEKVVFTPLETDETEIDRYLFSYFPEGGERDGLTDLRAALNSQSVAVMCAHNPFDVETLKWCIQGLLSEDLVSDEKRQTLQDLVNNDIILTEMMNILNIRYRDLKSWEWGAGEDGIPVKPRQQLNGKYRIWMDEDILQAILVHYVGIKLCIELKLALNYFIKSPANWSWHHGHCNTQVDQDRARYYLGTTPATFGGVNLTRRDEYTEQFFMSQLPDSIESLYASGGSYDQDGGEETGGFTSARNVHNGRKSRKSKPSASIKQEILRVLATEMLLHRHIHGGVAIVQTDMQWFASGLSHSTIAAVMRFIGFHEPWIDFMKKYLEAPLNMDDASDNRTPQGPQTRRRGVPMAHAIEKLLGELVLFFMDLVVNRETGMLLYRIHDDIWFVGDPKETAEAWRVMNEFAAVMGLEFNRHKTGSVYLPADGKGKDEKIAEALPKGDVTLGLLKIDEVTSKWAIDQKNLDAHVKQLHKQLDGCDSLISWVQTWNSCIGRFFGNTLGDPAKCLGTEHVDSILETHKRIQDGLFGGNRAENLTQYLRNTISDRFGVEDVPDAFFYFPEELGGLNVRDPFVPLLLVRNDLSDPDKLFRNYLDEEWKRQEAAKLAFEKLGESGRRKRMTGIFPHRIQRADMEATFKEGEQDRFMSPDEYTRARETTDGFLTHLYQTLRSEPYADAIVLTDQWASGVPQGLLSTSWTVELHRVDVLRRCGKLEMIDQAFLPLGCLEMMRKKKVTWQMVL